MRRTQIVSSSSDEDCGLAVKGGVANVSNHSQTCVLPSSSKESSDNCSGKSGLEARQSGKASSSDSDSETLPVLSRSAVLTPSSPKRSQARNDFETRTLPSRAVGNFTTIYSSYCRDKGEELQDIYADGDGFFVQDGETESSGSSSSDSREDTEPDDQAVKVDMASPIAKSTRSSNRRQKATTRSDALKSLSAKRSRTQTPAKTTGAASDDRDAKRSRTQTPAKTRGAASDDRDATSKGDRSLTLRGSDVALPDSRPVSRRSRQRKKASPPSSSSSASSSGDDRIRRPAGRKRRRVAGSSSEENELAQSQPADRRVSTRARKLQAEKENRRKDRFASLLSCRQLLATTSSRVTTDSQLSSKSKPDVISRSGSIIATANGNDPVCIADDDDHRREACAAGRGLGGDDDDDDDVILSTYRLSAPPTQQQQHSHSLVFEEFPSQPAKRQGQVWNSTLEAACSSGSTAWQSRKPATSIESVTSSSGEDRDDAVALCEISSDVDSDPDFVVSDGDAVEALEDAPAPVDLVVDRSFYANLKTRTSQATRKHANGGGAPRGRRARARPSFSAPARSRSPRRNRRQSKLPFRTRCDSDGDAILDGWSDEEGTKESMTEVPEPTGEVAEFYAALSSASLSDLQDNARGVLRVASGTVPSAFGRRLADLRHRGLSPLHAAVQCKRADAVEWMLGMQMDPTALSATDKVPPVLYATDVKCLQLLCDHSSVAGRPLLTDAQNTALLKRVLEWPHRLESGTEVEQSRDKCELWPVCGGPTMARRPLPRSPSTAEFGKWCGCCSLDAMQRRLDVRLVETAAAGLRALVDYYQPAWANDSSLVASACCASNSMCLEYLLSRHASVAYFNKEDRSYCYLLAVLAEQFHVEDTSLLPSSMTSPPPPAVVDDSSPSDVSLHSLSAMFGGDVAKGAVDTYTDVMAARCVRLLWKHSAPGLDEADIDGLTPLMRASAAGRVHCVTALLEAGASVFKRDLLGVSPLHLAAAEGHLQCIQVLLQADHAVDCVDNEGWPPLMYANFSSSESCVLALMKAKPQQIGLLGTLLRRSYACETQREKTQKVICNILTALGNHDSYYSAFNDFVRLNIDLLEQDTYAFASRSTGLLDLRNKRLWLERRLAHMREAMFHGGLFRESRCDVDRDYVLASALDQLQDVPALNLLHSFPSITFLNEPGTCTGPKREFLSALSREIAEPRHGLFVVCDGHHCMPRPGAIFEKVSVIKSGGNKLENLSHDLDLPARKKRLILIGRLVGSAVAHGYQVDFSMAKPFVKLLLGRPLNHPHELRYVDSELHRSTVEYLMNNPVSGVFDDMVFTCELPLPPSGRLVEFPLARNGENIEITDLNKSSYIYRLSKFKLEDSISDEVGYFVKGFYEVIPRAFLAPFTPAEFRLLMSGVSVIDVADWKRHTKYVGFSCDDIIIHWFWELVEAMSQEERSLLLQFATSLARLPPQGFAELRGLGGTDGFTIAYGHCTDKIPMASTCFNCLKLPRYSSPSCLREMVLVAVRHGSQGFSYC